MKSFENNAYFWQKLDTLFLSSQLKIVKNKGDHHSDFPNLIYPVSYGHLEDTNGNAEGISVYFGSLGQTITGLVVAVDILKKTLDVKALLGCTEEEVQDVLRFLNQTDFQKTVFLSKGSEIPSWGVTDN